jgi:hypothetical protein
VLIPTVFGWPEAGTMYDPPAITYPARGIAASWQQPARSPSDLANLIGTTRAMLLSALAEPASTAGMCSQGSRQASLLGAKVGANAVRR